MDSNRFPQSASELLNRFGGFHDACLREAAVRTETYVGSDGGMACPGHLDTTALLYFQSQGRLRAIEVRCGGVTQFRLRPTAENRDSIISSALFAEEAGVWRLSACFVGGPLVAPPNSVWSMPTRSFQDPDLEVIAQTMEWRPLPGAWGDHLRYDSASA